MNFNNIFNNIDGELFYNSIPVLDAENNWWGSPLGPPPGSVVGNVDYIPFLEEPAPVCNPHITCPSDMTVSNDTGQCSAFVTYTITAGSNDCGITQISCNPGGTETFSPPQQLVSITETQQFPVGSTTVTCTATNASGDTAECSFTVTVNDTEPPNITCPDNIVVEVGPEETGAIVTFPDPTVSDNCPGVTFSCSPMSGSFFPIGNTTVMCTATDTAGNEVTCSFNVSVRIRRATLLLELILCKDVQVQSEVTLRIQGDFCEPRNIVQTNKETNDFSLQRNNDLECIHAKRIYDWVVFSTEHQRRVSVPEECNAQVLNCLNEGYDLTVKCEEVPDSSNFTVLSDTRPAPGITCGRIVRIHFSVLIRIQYFCNGSLLCEFEVPVTTIDEIILYLPEDTSILAKISDVKCKVLGENC